MNEHKNLRSLRLSTGKFFSAQSFHQLGPVLAPRTSADMQHRKVRKGICAAELKDVVLWKYHYSAAQKAVAQKPRLISALESASLR